VISNVKRGCYARAETKRQQKRDREQVNVREAMSSVHHSTFFNSTQRGIKFEGTKLVF
jgi:hypothetical protein